MMPRMALGVNRLHRTTVELEPLLVLRDLDAPRIDRLYVAKQPVHVFLPVDDGCAGNQLCGIDHVSCAARMYDAACIRQGLHQQSGSARVIEVDMGEKHVIHITDVDVAVLERSEQQRHTVVRAGIDERGSGPFDDEMTCIVPRPDELSVYSDNTVMEVRRLRFDTRHSFEPARNCDATVIASSKLS